MSTPIQPDDDGLWRFDHPTSLWDHFDIAMVREFPRFAPTLLEIPALDRDPLYLHLGYGNKVIEHPYWLHLDMPDWDETMLLPYKEASIDGIATYHALDHMANPTGVLREMERVLVDNGWVVIIVPHYASELANTCLDHKSQFGVDTWRNVFSQRHYANTGEWQFRVGYNMIMGLTERNTVLVTQLIRKPR